MVFKLTPPATTGGAWTAAVLYSFTGSDGANPTGAGVIFDGSGALYGTTRTGGAYGNGTVFQLTPPKNKHRAWTESVLHDFTEVNDGGTPVAGLTFDRSGALYGTTYFGFGNPNSCGTVFKLVPPARKQDSWTETVLQNFNCSDGANPFAGVIFDQSGALYSTTDGTNATVQGGTVFKLTPPPVTGGAWAETVLYRFTGTPDGFNPRDNLVLDNSGALYGTTSLGGLYGQGTVFKLTP